MGYFKLALFIIQIVIIILSFDRVESAGKVVDVDGDLPKFLDEHPDKNWLVKFYAPWCYHCQQLERIYHTQGDLIVGRVDCTKHGHICEKYGVDSYPTIIHINRDESVVYKGDRSEASIVAFAERLQGPSVKTIEDCNGLKEATSKHGVVVVSTICNSTDELRLEFESLAKDHKTNYWFYSFTGDCGKYIRKEGVYLLKKHLDKGIKFSKDKSSKNLGQEVSLKDAIVDWLKKESFPVYGQINYRNIERIMSTGKLLAIAVLEEYKPARSFTQPSLDFHRSFERLATTYAKQNDDQILFGWTSDRELVEYITITSVVTPNVILLKPDFSYYIQIDQDYSDNRAKKADLIEANDNAIPDKLNWHRIRSTLTAAKQGKLAFAGGNSYLHLIMRSAMGNINRFLTMFKANPLLVSLLFGFPGVIIAFVIYTTCFLPEQNGGFDRIGPNEDQNAAYEQEAFSDEDENDFDDERANEEVDEEADEETDDERRELISNCHLKQD